jgi:hypothetical protein
MRLVALLLLAMMSSGAMADDPKGTFAGRLELLPAGCEKQHECTLKSDFGYIDSEGTGWQAKAGFITDGASIPWWAQPFIGGSFEKEYVRAAVVHDHYCQRPVRPWQKTHWVFFDALVASKVDRAKAALMYFGVLLGGPRWTELVSPENCSVGSNCLRNVPRRSLPKNATSRRNAWGRTFLVRAARYDDPSFMKHLKDAEKLIMERGGNVSLKELEERADRLSPKDFFSGKPDAISVE